VTTESEQPDRLARLLALAGELAAEVEELSEDSGNQFVSLARRARSNRRMIWIVAASVLVDVILSVVLTFSLVQVDGNANRIDALTQRLNISQTVTRRDTLCPLYTLLKAGDTKAARDAAPDKAAFDRSVAVIEQGYAALDCQQFSAPSPSPTG